MTTKTYCPRCEQRVIESKFLPFCSKQCADHDLGKWINEEHTIAGEISYDDVEILINEEEA